MTCNFSINNTGLHLDFARGTRLLKGLEHPIKALNDHQIMFGLSLHNDLFLGQEVTAFFNRQPTAGSKEPQTQMFPRLSRSTTSSPVTPVQLKHLCKLCPDPLMHRCTGVRTDARALQPDLSDSAPKALASKGLSFSA
eukprot:1346825-Amphidinium_carterae.1